MANEEWSWKRFFNGFISGQRYGKDFAILFRITILVGLGILLFFGIMKVKNMLFGNGATPTEHTDKSKIEGNTGTITQTDSHETATVVHNHSPLENGLLGLIFGAKDQTVKEGD